MINENKTQNENQDDINASVEDKVLKIINDKNLKPRSKWYFVAIESFFWAASILFVIMASLALSVFLYTIFDKSDSMEEISLIVGNYKYLLYALFWIVIFLIIAAVAYFNFLKTKHSYKTFYKARYVVLALYVVLAFIFYFTGSFFYVEKIFINELPYYGDNFDTKVSLWSRPGTGFLSGDILNIPQGKICVKPEIIPGTSTLVFIVSDFRDVDWNISASGTVWHFSGCLNPGDRIRVFGSSTGPNNFNAQVVWPW